MTGAIIVFRDISKQKADKERIEYMAFHDDLTKLPNLRYIKEKLTKDTLKHKSLAVLILDIDRFKHINEALGHSFGDLILQSVASRLKEQVPSHVFVGRLTGDEFIIVYPYLDQEDELIEFCKRIQDQINEPMQVNHLLLNVSVTIGSSIYPDHGNEGDELLKHANVALMEAVQQQVSFKMYQPCMDDKALDRLVLENDLHYALQKDELHLVYQPQVDIVTGQIKGWRRCFVGIIQDMAPFLQPNLYPWPKTRGLLSQSANGCFGPHANN